MIRCRFLAVQKIGIICFSRFLLVAHGRKPSKPHFHGPIKRRISEEDKKCVKIFLNFTYLHKTQPGQKTAGNFRIFLKPSTHQMFGYPGLDAGLNTSRFGGDIAFSDRKFSRGLPSLVYATSSQVIKPLEKTSFQFHD